MPQDLNIPAPEQLSTLWSWTNAYGPLSQPLTLAGDRLVGASSSGTLFAIDVYRGQAVGLTENVPQQGFPYSLASFSGNAPQLTAYGGNVYFLDGTQLVALRLADAQPLAGWIAPSLNNVYALHTVGEQIVAVHTGAGGNSCVSGFDRLSGQLIMGPVNLTEGSPGAASFDAKAAYFVADAALKAVNVDFGDTRWSFSPAAGAGALDGAVAPLVTDKLVIGAANSLTAIDITTGKQLWDVAASATAAVRWTTPMLEGSGQYAITSNSGGEILSFALADGKVAWRTSVESPGNPAIVDDVVCCTVANGQNLVRIATKDGSCIDCFALPAYASSQPPLVGNSAIFLFSADGSNIAAHSYSQENAAYFDGVSARIDIAPEQGQLDFGLDDFTVEAWIKTSIGGEILSSYPTQDGADKNGFRLNLTSDGRFRVAVVNTSLPNPPLNVGRTLRTGACDGEWHHVAFMRRNGDFIVLLDGLSLPVRLPVTTATLNAIGGSCGLTIGAYVPSAHPAAQAEEHFYGLIREVRVWTRALDVATIQTNLMKELSGTEPRIVGLWRLDENYAPGTTIEPVNAAAGHNYTATFRQPASAPTDLTLDDSAFPYLLQEARPHWPYAGTWAARGETPATGQAALSSAGTVAFITNNALYAVNKMDGKRSWGWDMSMGVSAPATDGSNFFVLSGEESLLCIDSKSGTKQQVPGFTNLTQGAQAFLATPAVTDRWLAAGTPDGSVYMGARGANAPLPLKASVAGPVVQLAFSNALLLVASGSGTAFQLTAFNPATGLQAGVPLSIIAPQFCLAGKFLLCIQSDGVACFDSSLSSAAPLRTSTAAVGADVTGMAAWPNSDLLVISTRAGDLHGLSLGKLLPRWQSKLPTGPAGGGNSAFAPVLDSAGRIYCATTSGTLAVLDPDNGSLMGLIGEDKAIVGTPMLDGGTAYFACVDASSPASCDGALHSFVFGQTVALRLGVDQQGKPADEPDGYAVITASDPQAGLHLMDVDASCVEAWINMPPLSVGGSGGGILGICPTGQADSFRLNLAIAADGTITYHASALKNDTWSGLNATVASKVCDGKWHHVAVSRPEAGKAVIYVDGSALGGVSLSTTSAEPATLQTGLKAYLGATAAADGSAATPLCGMLAEVRVWDTYLQSTEIATRMHVKLRGDEPDLLAYWNFDTAAIHDSSQRGNDGQLATGITEPAWWLTDLAFTQPSYPHIVTAATMTQAGQAGASGQEADTIYALSLTVRRADKTGLANQALHLWYVRHDDSEPATITVNGTVLTGVTPGSEPDPGTGSGPLSCLALTTLADGTTKFTVETSLTGHGPSLDVWSTFMPGNERFHVNCLIDNQSMAKPVPPNLTAQTKLVQDYSYTQGNQIDDTRDRSTHRVVLTAANADHSVRVDEAITLWASDDMVIEVAGQSYTINADNNANFVTSTHGELCLVVAADSFSTPTLYARAGFMDRNDRIVVTPAEDGQKVLGSVSADTLTTPKLGNWKKGHTDADKQSILDSDYAPHAPDIAQAVNHLMSAVKPAGAIPSASNKLALRRGVAAQTFPEMRQPAGQARSDLATVYRTPAHILRKAPINPDALKASLNGAVGFVFKPGKNGTGFDFHLLHSMDDVARLCGSSIPQHHLFGGIFDSIWDGIKDAAEDAYEAAEQLAIYVTDVVTVAITTLEKTINVVVDSIEKAIDAVVNFFKQLIADIKFLILLLRALFDWDGIAGAARLIRTMLENTGKILAAPGAVKPITNAINTMFDDVEQVLGIDTSPLSGTSTPDLPTQDCDAVSLAGGVHPKMLFHKMQDYGGSILPGFPLPGDLDLPPFVLKTLSDFCTGLGQVASDLPSMDFHAMGTDLQGMLKALGKDVFEAGRDYSLESVNCLSSSFSGWITMTEMPVDVPFISSLYKWITGDDLTLIGLISFLLGFPVHVVYFIANDGSRFCDDGAGWLPAPAAGRAGALTAAPHLLGTDDDNQGKEIAYVVMKCVHTLFVIGTDALFSRNANTGLRAIAKIGRGATGIFCSVWAFSYFFPRYRQVMKEDDPNDNMGFNKTGDLIEATRYLGLALSLIGDGTALATGIKRLRDDSGMGIAPGIQMADMGGDGGVGDDYPPAQAAQPANIPTNRIDNVELVITALNAVVACVQISFQIVNMVRASEKLSDEGEAKALTMLVAGRYMSLTVPRLFGWLFTQTAAGNLIADNPEAKLVVLGIRAAANVTGVALHSTAAFNHMKL